MKILVITKVKEIAELEYIGDCEKYIKEEKTPSEVKKVIEKFISRQKPIILQWSITENKQTDLIKTIESETKEDSGWLKNEPIGFNTNNFIESTKDLKRTRIHEMNGFQELLFELTEICENLFDENKVLKNKLSAERVK